MTARIALILDCDGTLADDTTSQALEAIFGNQEAVTKFWEENSRMVELGWDGPLDWIPRLTSAAKRAGHPLTHDTLRSIGANLRFYAGVPGVFDRLRSRVARLGGELDVEATLEVHIITGGLEELLLASSLHRTGVHIWGCLLAFGQDGEALGPKSIVTFTEKTKFVFAIHKGISKAELRTDPTSVNKPLPRSKRPVLFRNMIYVGDGPTDIPCFSMISQQGGTAVGIRRSDRRLGVPGSEVLVNYRPRWGPFEPDYVDGSALSELLTDLLNDILVREGGSDRSAVPHRTV